MGVIGKHWGHWGLGLALLTTGCAAPRGRPVAEAAALPKPAASTAAAAKADLSVARRFEQQQQWPKAREAYVAALVHEPDNVTCLHRLAVVCTAMEDHAAAAEYYNRALVLAPENVDLLTDAGYACYLRGEEEAAEALLRDAVAQAPQHQRAVNNLALLLGMAGRLEEAFAAFRQVNEPVDAWRNLSYVYQQRGEWDLALACYEEARKLDADLTMPASLLAHRETVAKSTPVEPPPVMTAEVLAEEVEVLAEDDSTVTAVSESRVFVTPVTNAEAAFIPPEPVVGTADEPVLDERDFGPFEPPVIVDPEAVPRESARLPPGALPVITPGQPAISPFAEAVDPEFAVVLTDRPWKRGVMDAPFDVVYEGDLSPEPVSPDTIELAGDEWADGVIPAAAVVEATPVESTPAALALGDCCLVALHDDRRLVAARPEFAVTYRDQLFYFASAAAAQQFAEHPENYLPAAAGLDVVAVRSGWVVVAGTLDHAVWFRGKLFLFASADNLVAFQAHPYRYVDYE